MFPRNQKNVRNFAIIAHIDHGKSTLSDRLIQLCGGLTDREMSEQVLDSMELERERGITIKAQSVSLKYTSRKGDQYSLNFIDTPGHVDFSYEVSRSLSACEGALLVVEAAQGVEAQSVANCYTAIEQDLEVLPVLNKIDLPQAEPEAVINEIEEIIGLDAMDACRVSAKTGVGIDDLLEQLAPELSGRARQTVFNGGPVEPERGFVLHDGDRRWESSAELGPLTLTTSQDILRAMACGEGPQQALITLGYAGWGAGQLEQELANNVWLSCPAEHHILFQLPSSERLNAAARTLGIDWSLLTSQAGHA